MPIAMSELERLVKAAFPDADITIQDLAGDNDHYALTVASSVFQGKSRVEQHKTVNEALKGTVGGSLHALALKTVVK